MCVNSNVEPVQNGSNNLWVGAGGTYTPPPIPCPSCGHCPTCGRGRSNPPYNPLPWGNLPYVPPVYGNINSGHSEPFTGKVTVMYECG